MAIFINKYNGIPPACRPLKKGETKLFQMQKLRKKFPVLNQCIYANTAAAGLLGEDLLEWRQGHDLDYLIGGSAMKEKGFAHMPTIKKKVGDFFHCGAEQVALVPNFSLGLNLLLEGLPKEKRVLLLEADYPSLNWPFESRNLPREYVPIDGGLEEAIHNQVKSGKFDVLALSLVQWINGVRIDLDFLKELKREFPQLLILADGTQFCGMERFNFGASGIDILGCSAYKWLLAGYGNGFFLIKDGVGDLFDPKSLGHGSVDGDPSKREGVSLCKKLEPGHLDSLNFGSLEFALDFLDQIGQDTIERQVQKLSQKAMEAFSHLGLLEDYVPKRNRHSSIFLIQGDDKRFNRLREHNVVASPRGGGIRLSFHFYNTEEEIDQIVKILGQGRSGAR